MTLPINILQSLISRQRTVITSNHELVNFWKVVAPEHNHEEIGHVDYCYSQAANISKGIEKLVIIQKALKAELATQIATARDNAPLHNIIAA